MNIVVVRLKYTASNEASLAECDNVDSVWILLGKFQKLLCVGKVLLSQCLERRSSVELKYLELLIESWK